MAKEVNSGTVKCPFCRKLFIIDEYKCMFFNGHYYHNGCFLKSGGLIPDAKNQVEQKTRLLEYLSNILDEEYFREKLPSQLKTLLSCNYKYEGIHATLLYILDIKKQKINLDYGISIVKFTYNDAKRYYEDLYKKQDLLSQKIIKSQENIVYVKKKKDEYKISFIDMEKL